MTWAHAVNVSRVHSAMDEDHKYSQGEYFLKLLDNRGRYRPCCPRPVSTGVHKHAADFGGNRKISPCFDYTDDILGSVSIMTF